MILARAPLRVSLVGGGTDFASFYRSEGFGAVVSFTIDKYVNVLLNRKFDLSVRVSYRETENVAYVSELRHDIVRESLIHFGVLQGIEAVTISDIPGEGSGLGSSSSLAVALNLALRKYTARSVNLDPCFIAEDAYIIERTHCAHAVGKQDHYAAAYGGLHGYIFESDGSVVATGIRLNEEQTHFLENDLMLFYTGRTRKAQGILERLKTNLQNDEAVKQSAHVLRDMAVDLQKELLKGNLQNIPVYLREGWKLKKRMTAGVSDDQIDAIHDAGIAAGAKGGKLLGAGGGGFMLFAGCWNHQLAIQDALRDFKYVPFHLETNGVRVETV